MKQLGTIFQQLNAREIDKLSESMTRKPKFRQLVEIIRDYPEKEDLFYLNKMGYEEGSQTFYTLKHRFLSFLSKELFKHTTNPLDDLKTRITHLNVSIYSGSDSLQKLEMKRLLKIALKLGDPSLIQQLLKIKLIVLTRELAVKEEIQDVKEQLFHYTEMRNALEEAETDFFHYVFYVNSSPFFFNEQDVLSVKERFLSILTAYPDNPIFQFLCQTILLEIEIRRPGLNPIDFLSRVMEMELNYKNTVLKFKYPLADIGFSVMRSKLYLFSHDIDGFCTQLEKERGRLSQVYENPMFPCVQIYFHFAFFYAHARQAISGLDLDVFLKKYGISSQPLFQFSLFFFKACRAFNAGDFNTAVKMISKARQGCDKNVRSHSAIPTELAVLGLFCQVLTSKPKASLIRYEINTLRYTHRISVLKNTHSVERLISFAHRALNSWNLPDLIHAIPSFIRELQSDKLLLLLLNHSESDKR